MSRGSTLLAARGLHWPTGRVPGETRLRRTALLLVLWATLAGTAYAAGTDMQKLQLEVFIEGHSTNLIAEILRSPDGRFAARRSELREVGVVVPGSGRDEDVIPFESIPGFGMRYDEPGQKLHLTLAPEARIAKEYSARQSGGLVLKPDIKISSEYGSVLNYNLFGTAARGYSSRSSTYTTGSATLEHRAFSPYGVIQNSGIAGTTLTREGLLRLESSYTYAHYDSSTQITAGDAISGGLGWTRPIRFAGLRISREFGLRTDLITAPLPSVSGSAAVPSTVDVYVDNMRIATQDVGAGPFRISNLPVPGESGTARVVVRDVSGRETVTSVPFFTSPKLLAAGQLDFSADAGLPRQNYAISSFDYSRQLMGMGSLRYGFHDRVTLESHVEGTREVFVGGLGTTFAAGPLGLFSVAGAASRTHAATGGLGFANWQIGLRGVFVGASTQRTIGKYEDVASMTARATNRVRTSNMVDSGFYPSSTSPKVARAVDRLSLGVPLERWNASIAASFTQVNRVDDPRSRLVSLTYTQTIAKDYNTFVHAFHDLADRRQTGVFAGVSFTFGKNLIAQSAATFGRESRGGSLEVTKPIGPDAFDYGWRLYNAEGGQASRSAAADFRTPWMRGSAGLRQDGQSFGGYGEVEGALVAAPGGLFVSRRIHDAFAIVDVGAPGVEVLHENRPVGRTDWRGLILVPEAPSFQRTRIAISPETLPGEYHAELTETDIMPGFRVPRPCMSRRSRRSNPRGSPSAMRAASSCPWAHAPRTRKAAISSPSAMTARPSCRKSARRTRLLSAMTCSNAARGSRAPIAIRRPGLSGP